MRALGRTAWATLAVATGVLLAVLAFLFLRTQHFDEHQYQEHVTSLRLLKQLDAQSEVDVLRSRTGLVEDYDRLSGALGRTTVLLEQLRSRLEGEAHDERPQLMQRCEALHGILQEKAGLIERFKSDHSVLRNSLAYLPVAADEARVAIGEARRASSAARAHERIDDVLLASMLFSQRASRVKAAAIGVAVDELEALSLDLSGDAPARVHVFGTHARTILQEQVVVDGLLSLIAALPSDDAIDEIGNLLLNEQQRAQAQGETDRLYLLVLSTILVGLLLYAALRIVRSYALIRQSNEQLVEYGQGLEGLVAERVAELRDSEARMARLARYDSLTGLPNRHLFRDRLREAMARADRDERSMALMFVDLDHFKQINDSLGHVVGDGVLQAVAERLRETMRDGDTVARLGGDEFTIICEGLSSADNAMQVAAKVREALAPPLIVDGRDFTVSASIGIACHVPGSDDSDSLLRAADIAMYRAKDSGRNAYALFVPEMAVQVSKRVRMETLLRQALERGEFALVYQPKVDLASGRIAGVEALLRWNSAELGTVSPTDFIPLAEEMGLIVDIGEWVLGVACAQGAAWLCDGLPPLMMAVNLSPRELKDPRLIARIARVLRDSGFPAASLELELTEGVVMDDVKKNIETLTAIRALGVRLAVDDFGTGYSSLAYLSRLPIQTLKIDRAFIVPMVDDANATTLVATMVTLAHSLALQVVAEGVETAAQRNLLRTMGCDQMQGYLFSRPIAADALARLVRERDTMTAHRRLRPSKPARAARAARAVVSPSLSS